MDRFVGLIFLVVGFFDTKSGDPVMAAFKRARLSAIVLGVSEILCLTAAFLLAPDATQVAPNNATAFVRTFQEWVANGFTLVAMAMMLGVVYFIWRCWRICAKPEHHL